MDRSIALATDVQADIEDVFEAVSTTAGQRSFWTADCDVSAERARFGFPQAPVDLEVDVTAQPGSLVRMRVTSGISVLGRIDLGVGARRCVTCRDGHERDVSSLWFR